MPVYVVAHRPTQESVTLWIGWWTKSKMPPLSLKLAGQEERHLPLSAEWNSIGLGNDAAPPGEVPWSKLWWQTVTVHALTPASQYFAYLIDQTTGARISECVFDTLPVKLPQEPVGTLQSDGGASQRKPSDLRGFCVFLGSCYWGADENDDRR